jgi:hypothetical protein
MYRIPQYSMVDAIYFVSQNLIEFAKIYIDNERYGRHGELPDCSPSAEGCLSRWTAGNTADLGIGTRGASYFVDGEGFVERCGADASSVTPPLCVQTTDYIAISASRSSICYRTPSCTTFKFLPGSVRLKCDLAHSILQPAHSHFKDLRVWFRGEGHGDETCTAACETCFDAYKA